MIWNRGLSRLAGLWLITATISTASVLVAGSAVVNEPSAKRTVLLTPPEVFTRERLVLDRYREMAWLEKVLINSESTSFGVQRTHAIRSSASTTTGVGLSILRKGKDAADGSSDAPNSPGDPRLVPQDVKETIPPVVAPEDQPQVSPADSFADLVAYRSLVRAKMMETALDDSHDIGGFTLYVLKFDASFLAKGPAPQWAFAQVHVRGGPTIASPPSPQELRQLPAEIASSRIKDFENQVEHMEKYETQLREYLSGTLADGISRELADLSARARSRSLSPTLLNDLRAFMAWQANRALTKGLVDRAVDETSEFEELSTSDPQGTDEQQSASATNAKSILEAPAQPLTATPEPSLAKSAVGKPELATDDCSAAATLGTFLSRHFADVYERIDLDACFLAEYLERSLHESQDRPEFELLLLPASDGRCVVSAGAMRFDPWAVVDTFDPEGQVAPGTTSLTEPQGGRRFPRKVEQQYRASLKYQYETTRGGYDNVMARLRSANALSSPILYSVAPTDSADRTSEHFLNERVAHLSAGLSLNGDITSLISNFNRVKSLVDDERLIARTPRVIGFGGELAPETAKGESQGSAAFGWLIAGNLDPSTRQSSRLRAQLPRHETLLAAIAVPAWWSKVDIVVTTGWLRNSAAGSWSVVRDQDPETMTVRLPMQKDSLFTALSQTSRNRPNPDDPYAEYRLELDRGAMLVIKGEHLWRDSVVAVGSQLADSVTVLPDMNGVVAKFDKILPAALATSRCGRSPVTVWTSFGSAIAGEAKIASQTGEKPPPGDPDVKPK